MSALDVRLARAARLAREAADDSRGDVVPVALLDGLKEVVSGLCVCYAELEPRCQRVIAFQSTDFGLPHNWTDAESNATFWRVYPQMGPMRHIRDGTFNRGDVLLLTDFTPDRILANTEVYRDYFLPNGERYAMAVPLPTLPAHIRGFFFFRWDRDFTESDRDLLTLLHPHLEAAYEAHRRRRSGVAPLTPRQWQVLRYLAQGQSTEQVAAAMCVSTSTIRKHLENVYQRLGVTNRAAAIGKAMLHAPP